MPDTRLPILYSFRRCPFAMRARLALAVSDSRCELREVVLRDKPTELLEVSPKATVPVLVLAAAGPEVLEHSLDIMDWALRRHDPEGWLSPPAGTPQEMRELIARCDGPFKQDLDRYKYPNRYPGVDAETHRANGGVFLTQLDARLRGQSHLFGTRPCLADRAIAPFVRQFAHTDIDWFRSQPWPALHAWLDAFLAHPLFERVMRKYPQWRAGDAPSYFPA